MVEIHRDEHLLARFVDAGGSDRPLVVTFANLSAAPGLDRPGFGEGFCRKYGLDAVHVTAAANHWYQRGSMPELLAAVRRFGSGHGSIVAYGTSMGGYQALRAAGPLGASRCVTISPQYSVDPARAPWERRWAAEREGLEFHEGELAPGGEAVLVYDPWERLDRLQADEIRARLPVREVRLPFAGHRVMHFLNEAGLLSSLTLELLGVSPSSAGLRGRIRAGRRASASYFLGVAGTERLPLAWRERALRSALDLSPGEPRLWLRLGGLLIDSGDFAGAREAAGRAAAAGGDEVVAALLMSKAAARSGDWATAVEWLERVVRLDPGRTAARDQLARARAKLAARSAAGS